MPLTAALRWTGSPRGAHVVDAFDAARGTDTASAVRLPWYKTLAGGVGYGTVSEHKISALLDPCAREATVVDLGCGKGRTLIVAAEMGFRAIEGVEYEAALVATARENLRRVGARAIVLESDARRYHPPAGPCVVYLYNPFGLGIMRRVATNLRRHQWPVTVIYVNPDKQRGCRACFDWMTPVELTPEQRALFSPGSVAIWRR